MVDRKAVFSECMNLLNESILDLHSQLKEIQESIEGESKSTMGDKHETSRVMLQQEQEKMSGQLQDLLQQRNMLEQSENPESTNTISRGNLVLTDKGYIYIATALGRIKINGTDIMVISPASPMGHELLNKQKGEEAMIQQNKLLIREIS
jgi:transcription elongation GreA/GreB family factor